MFIQPWDAGLDEAEWQAWIAEGHDFGQLSVNGLPGHPPVAVPTHFCCDGGHLLIHLARPNPVWKAIERDPNVLFTVFGDYAFIPGPWRARPNTPPKDGVPTSYRIYPQCSGLQDSVGKSVKRAGIRPPGRARPGVTCGSCRGVCR